MSTRCRPQGCLARLGQASASAATQTRIAIVASYAGRVGVSRTGTIGRLAQCAEMSLLDDVATRVASCGRPGSPERGDTPEACAAYGVGILAVGSLSHLEIR